MATGSTSAGPGADKRHRSQGTHVVSDVDLYQLPRHPRSDRRRCARRAGPHARRQPHTTRGGHSGKYSGKYAALAQAPAAHQARRIHAGFQFHRPTARPTWGISGDIAMNGTSATATLAMVLDPAERGHHRLAWLSTVDHKRIAVLYLLAGLFFFVVGGTEALFMRLQLAVPNNHFLQPDTYNQLFTMHGTTMIFLVIMPLSFGFVNYVLPLQIGARDMAFPRLNALGFWLVPFGGILLHFSVLAGGAPAVGWFSYAPLSETPYSSTLGVDYWAVALFVLGIGSISFAINVIATVISRRAPGMTMLRLPLFTWINFVNAFIIILALPVLNAGLAMLLIDRQLEGHFFLPFHGGSAVLWQHIFWAFGHPVVYIMVLPAFGIVSEVIPVFSRKPIFGYEFVAGSSVAIAILSMSVWGYH